MPVASSSRRSRRAQPADDIEEDAPSQTRDDDDDDDAPPSKAKGKAKTGTVKVKEELRRLAEGAEAPADDGRIDIDNFKNHPLTKADAGRLNGISSDWLQMRKQLQHTAFGLVRNAAVAAEDAATTEEDQKVLIELESTMRELIDLDAEMQASENVLHKLNQRVAAGDEITEPTDEYEKGVKKMMAEYLTSTTRQKYAGHDAYKTYKQAIWEVKHPDEAMPHVSEFIEREEGDDSDDEDDVQVGGVTQDFKCPLTLIVMTDPLTSKLCEHSYSAEAIREYLKKGKKPCPAAGCRVVIGLNDLVADPEFTKRARAAARRAQRQEEDSDSDADEVID